MTKISKVDCERFEQMAVPHSWLLVACDLHEQAELVFTHKGSRITYEKSVNGAVRVHDRANRAAFLLGGFALENMIKAYLVFENPSWIGGGKLSSQLTHHSLTKLASKSRKLPWPKKGRLILEAFESGLTSWARYPCPSSAYKPSFERYFTDELWSGYTQQMSRYVVGLESLLLRHWTGPYQFSGSYEFDAAGNER